MLEKLVTEDIIQNGFSHVNNLPPPSSDPPTIKKKRNLPGTPGKYTLLTISFFKSIFYFAVHFSNCLLLLYFNEAS